MIRSRVCVHVHVHGGVSSHQLVFERIRGPNPAAAAAANIIILFNSCAYALPADLTRHTGANGQLSYGVCHHEWLLRTRCCTSLSVIDHFTRKERESGREYPISQDVTDPLRNPLKTHPHDERANNNSCCRLGVAQPSHRSETV